MHKKTEPEGAGTWSNPARSFRFENWAKELLARRR